MNPLYEAALEVQRFCRKKRWRFCIIGGVAVARWGEPRATQDVDLSLLVGLGNEPRIVQALRTQFPSRVDDPEDFALQSRMYLGIATNRTALDMSLAAFPYEEQMIARSSRFTFVPKVSLVTLSAEDLIVMKAIADRPIDGKDILGIIRRQGRRLDWNYLLRSLSALCELKEDMNPLDQLKKMRAKEQRS